MSNIKPYDIIHLKELIPNISERIDYSTKENFTGEVVPGYHSAKAFLQIEAAKALLNVQKELETKDYGLLIFDAYRPQKGVNFFFNEWRKKSDILEIKNKYYPTLSKEQIFEEEFLAIQSSHTRASTVDLSMIELKTQNEVDMGGIFDYFHEVSYTETKLINESQQKFRLLLKNVMEKNGFINYSK